MEEKIFYKNLSFYMGVTFELNESPNGFDLAGKNDKSSNVRVQDVKSNERVH